MADPRQKLPSEVQMRLATYLKMCTAKVMAPPVVRQHCISCVEMLVTTLTIMVMRALDVVLLQAQPRIEVHVMIIAIVMIL